MKEQSYQRFSLGLGLGRVVRIPMLIFFLSYLVSCTPVSQQKKQQAIVEDLLSITFPTEKEGWTCGRRGFVLHTADGGKTWIPQDSGTDYTLSSIFFVDSRNGWAVGDEGTVVHTADGGKTWQKQKSPVPFFLMRVYFATSLKGWIVTEQTHILNTDDGGKTWKIQFKDEDYILKSISFCDAVHGWAVGEYGYIYHTRDGGGSWKKQSGYFQLDKETGRPQGGIFLFDVVAVNPKTAWVVGIDGYVSKTVDGGKTWQKVPTGAPKTQLFCVASDKMNSILIGGKGVFLSSADGGKSWGSPSFEPPISYGWLYGLTKRQCSSFAAVGWEGAIYLSSSTSWHRVIY